jgi:hypothetical protein
MRQELARGSVTEIVARALAECTHRIGVQWDIFPGRCRSPGWPASRTHWSEVDALKGFRPAVLVDGDAIHIEDADIWTQQA